MINSTSLLFNQIGYFLRGFVIALPIISIILNVVLLIATEDKTLIVMASTFILINIYLEKKILEDSL
jgi:hypothetical protein